VDVSRDIEDPIEELQDRLRRYPADRYPIQHATAEFHLGIALADRDRLEEAEAALRRSAGLFDPSKLPLEHGKARNSLGAVLRLLGRTTEASDEFVAARSLFEQAGRELELAAALFNLGLVQRDLGHDEEAVDAFRRAQEIFEGHRLPSQTGAAAREVGATLLVRGELDDAWGAFEEAIELAERAGDQAAMGAAANGLGLIELARGTPAHAVERFRAAASAHPRSVRPGEFAMAKANLALAYEGIGDAARARLAARQALGAALIPDPVREQATAILAHLDAGDDDLAAVLESEPRERWALVVREEAVRWADTTPPEQIDEARAWVASELRRPELGADMAEAWLGSLLELPPAAMESLIRAGLQALGERTPGERRRFRDDVRMAMSRFHVPQLMRLKDTFNRLAAELGQETSW
jgi:tetratricopeptide (TPR) repeat protein